MRAAINKETAARLRPYFVGYLALAAGFWAQVLFPPPAPAYEMGISGSSGLAGPTCADSCHGDALAPRVELIVPEVVRLGEVVSWRLALVPSSSRHVAGGLNLAVSGGELGIEPIGLRLDENEVTHAFPRRSADLNRDGAVTAADLVESSASVEAVQGKACLAADTNGDGRVDRSDAEELSRALFSGSPLQWIGTWRADAPGRYEFFAAAVAANCNGARSGDGVGTARAAVVVVQP